MNSDAPLPGSMVAQERVLGIQRKLHKRTQDEQDRRFSDLDGESDYYVEQVRGVQKFLAGLREELRSGSFRPGAVKQRAIPKRGGKLRYLGIPTVCDRVVQAALKTVR